MQRDFDYTTLIERIEHHQSWWRYITDIKHGTNHATIHLAIFTEPYLSHIINGIKTVESRFSRVHCAPFGEVREGDVILAKQAGGPVKAITKARNITYYSFAHDCIEDIRSEFGEKIAAPDEFWESKRTARYGTVITLSDTEPLTPFAFSKSDRRGWVPLDKRQLAFEF